MAGKINRRENFKFQISHFVLRTLRDRSNFRFLIFTILFLLLIYTRFVNIGWGLPYLMHPDERNMGIALEQLKCNKFLISNFQFSNCLNPHFFAYGQFPLYLGYLLITVYKLLNGIIKTPINFIEAVLSLRIISATASIINVFVLFNIIQIVSPILKIKNQISKIQIINQKFYIFIYYFAFCFLIFTLVPYAIQFSHFGTTESLLMLFYSLIVYLSLKLIDHNISEKKFVLLSSFFCGLAIATKVSSLVFLLIPVVGYILRIRDQRLEITNRVQRFFVFSLSHGFSTLIFALIFSPHNLINWKEFIFSMSYESIVATGQTVVFYTKQFVGTIPVIFQLTKIFPYVLGWPLYIFFFLGFIFISFRDSKINFLRFSFLIYFLPTSFLFAKWTRFMAPVFPLMVVFAVIYLFYLVEKINNQILKRHIKNQKFYILIGHFVFCLVIFTLVIPGILYLFIYHQPDVRFRASEWIYKNIPTNSVILSETANVVDIPIENPKQIQNSNYKIISFNFYNLDQDSQLQKELKEHLKEADYIIVPSRRIFMNHTCWNFQLIFKNKCEVLKQKYPLLNEYYRSLFDGQLGFKKVVEFRTDFIFDERAEETFSVFDHPTIRIYKKI